MLIGLVTVFEHTNALEYSITILGGVKGNNRKTKLLRIFAVLLKNCCNPS